MVDSRAAPRMSDEAVRAKTGKDWEEWFTALDAAGAAQMSHQEIVAYLAANHGLDGWWQQMVTVTYEQARGLREKHQRPDGYQISASKTVAVPLATLFRAWTDPEQRARWLPEDSFLVHRATPEKYVRARWDTDGGRVDVSFYAKGEDKSQVSVNHGQLASSEDAARMKVYWAERLQLLKELLES